jgi:hypothetical protein
VNVKKHISIEIFGAPGVGKSTFIKHNGYVSSWDLYHKELDSRIRNEFKKKLFIPLPDKFIRLYRGSFQNRYDEQAMSAFEEKYKEFMELCLYIIFNSPVSAERRIRCYKFLVNAVMSWWLVEEREGMIWDESFAKAVLYVCGMEPDFSEKNIYNLVSRMPKRDKYILIDGLPQQGVAGQIKRGKYYNNLSEIEKEEKLRSATKYRNMAERLSDELLHNGCIVEKHYSSLKEEI